LSLKKNIALSHIYQLNQLRFSYASKEVLALDELQFEEGKATALIGANGSGKSTLLNLLAFLASPTQGDIFFYRHNDLYPVVLIPWLFFQHAGLCPVFLSQNQYYHTPSLPA
jgi:ABC-type nitrate/sulfonate/bicarbonate transport system ATPase subunit